MSQQIKGTKFIMGDPYSEIEPMDDEPEDEAESYDCLEDRLDAAFARAEGATMDQDFNEVFGLWIRTHRGKLQVLVETRPRVWRQVFLEEYDSKNDLVCQIINPSGIRRAPFVDTTVDFSVPEEPPASAFWSPEDPRWGKS